ncbi:hypothetical protein D3C81_1311640 [compost metagenome]
MKICVHNQNLWAQMLCQNSIMNVGGQGVQTALGRRLRASFRWPGATHSANAWASFMVEAILKRFVAEQIVRSSAPPQLVAAARWHIQAWRLWLDQAMFALELSPGARSSRYARGNLLRRHDLKYKQPVPMYFFLTIFSSLPPLTLISRRHLFSSTAATCSH